MTTEELDQAQRVLFDRRLRLLSETEEFRRYRRLIKCTTGLGSDRNLLAAILLVEMSARPTWWRTVEWALIRAGRFARIPVQLLPRTLGPFQLRRAPADFVAALRLADEELASAPADLAGIAAFWHGAASRQPGSTMSYGVALSLAVATIGRRSSTTAMTAYTRNPEVRSRASQW